jgi:hypothetical protein
MATAMANKVAPTFAVQDYRQLKNITEKSKQK